MKVNDCKDIEYCISINCCLSNLFHAMASLLKFTLDRNNYKPLLIVDADTYTESHQTCHSSLKHDFGKYGLILLILSLLDCAMQLQLDHCYIFTAP